MKRELVLRHEFVDFIPNEVADGVVYVSIPYATVAHKCCCGCGMEVVTPLSPTDWELIFDGESISLDPSIGNWSFDCKSHYWIRRNKVRWADRWSQEEIDAVRSHERFVRQTYYSPGKKNAEDVEDEAAASKPGPKAGKPKRRLWQWFWKWRW